MQLHGRGFIQKSLIAKYPLFCIFNANETELYFRVLPEHTYAFKNKKKLVKNVQPYYVVQVWMVKKENCLRLGKVYVPGVSRVLRIYQQTILQTVMYG